MRKSVKISLSAILIVSLFIFQSCRKNFDILELSNTTTDSLEFEGSIAIPVIDSKFTLGSFIPQTDSSLWAEVDNDGVVHLRMYYKDFIVVDMNQIFTSIVYPAPLGTPVVASETTIETDTAKMKVYNKMLSGHLYFADPRITFKITNEIPVVTFFRLDTLIFYNLNSEALSHTSVKKYFIGAPTSEGTSEYTEILVNKNEIPILPDVFSPVPRSISFVISAGSDETQILPYNSTGNEKLRTDVDIDLPLDARLVDMVMGDTVNFDLGGETYSQIKSLTLKARFNNGFPIDGRTQIYFTDSTATGEPGNIIDSAFVDLTHPDIYNDGWNFATAQTDALGFVTIPTESNFVIIIDQERLQNLKDRNVTKMIVKAKLNSFKSTTGLNVKILSDYKLGIKISVKADFEVSSNDQF